LAGYNPVAADFCREAVNDGARIAAGIEPLGDGP
jgi:hypothetical protein